MRLPAVECNVDVRETSDRRQVYLRVVAWVYHDACVDVLVRAVFDHGDFPTATFLGGCAKYRDDTWNREALEGAGYREGRGNCCSGDEVCGTKGLAECRLFFNPIWGEE